MEEIKAKSLDGNRQHGTITIREWKERGEPYIRLDVEPSPQLLTAPEAVQLANALIEKAEKLLGVLREM